MKQLLRWPGSKRRLAARIAEQLGPVDNGNRYIELFAGSAAVFFHMEPAKAVLVDVCKPLMAFYKAIKSNPDGFSDEIDTLIGLEFGRKTYDLIKAQWDGNCTGAEFAARLLYLNKLGFNGLFRLNKDMQYNVAWGKKASLPAFPDRFEIRAISKLLGNAKLYSEDYAEILAGAVAGDKIYADPPYWNTYDRYSGEGFSNENHRELARGLFLAAERNCTVVASNIDVPEVRELYQWAMLIEVPVLHKIGCTAGSRKTVGELLIVSKPPFVDARQLGLL